MTLAEQAQEQMDLYDNVIYRCDAKGIITEVIPISENKHLTIWTVRSTAYSSLTDEIVVFC